MARPKGSEPYEHSAIKVKPFKESAKESRNRAEPRKTRDGKIYQLEMQRINGLIARLPIEERHTIRAFCKNHYVEIGTIPSTQALRKVFPNIPPKGKKIWS